MFLRNTAAIDCMPCSSLHVVFFSTTKAIIRVAVGLRLGVKLCVPVNHAMCLWCCRELGRYAATHGLACKQAPGRMAWHGALNDLIYRALLSAGIPSTKEPAGLLPSDGKRPEGLSLIPWRNGIPVGRDVTGINPLADASPHLNKVLITASSYFFSQSFSKFCAHFTPRRPKIYTNCYLNCYPN